MEECPCSTSEERSRSAKSEEREDREAAETMEDETRPAWGNRGGQKV